MVIPLSNFDAVTEAVADYRITLKVREAVAEGDIVLTVKNKGNTYDLVQMFGTDGVRATLISPLDAVLQSKVDALLALGVQA